MKTVYLVAMVVGIAAIVALGAFGLVKANANATDKATSITPTTTPAFSCSSCQGKCTAQSNCGSATCGAVNGGACGCQAKQS